MRGKWAVTLLLLALQSLEAKPFVLLQQRMLWDINGEDMCFRQRGPENWIEPVNYVEGSIYLRLAVLSKPSSKPVFVQMCLFQKGWQVENCADGITFSDEGVYIAKLECRPIDFWKKGGVSLDFSAPFSHVCFAVKENDCEGRLMLYSNCGEACYQKDDLELHMPMEVHATVIVVEKGESFEVPETWSDFPDSSGAKSR